jgi:hypothetical protein
MSAAPKAGSAVDDTRRWLRRNTRSAARRILPRQPNSPVASRVMPGNSEIPTIPGVALALDCK